MLYNAESHAFNKLDHGTTAAVAEVKAILSAAYCPHVIQVMQLTQFEQQVRNILEECTGYTFNKVYDADEDCNYYDLIDQYGDVDGDPFYEFDDLLEYIENNSQVADELNLLLTTV